jgi:hypothetical protein
MNTKYGKTAIRYFMDKPIARKEKGKYVKGKTKNIHQNWRHLSIHANIKS